MCDIPMWKKDDYVCSEHAQQPPENVWIDSNGLQRKELEEGMVCTVLCPKERSWSEDPDIITMDCFAGSWTDSSGSPITGISCSTSPRAWFVLVVVLILIIILI